MGSRYSMTLKRDAKSGAFKDRIRLPEDVRLKYQTLYGPAWEEKFHRPADTPSDKAVAEHAAWAAKVKGRIAALRDSKGGKGVDLTQREADALAGDWHRWFTSTADGGRSVRAPHHRGYGGGVEALPAI